MPAPEVPARAGLQRAHGVALAPPARLPVQPRHLPLPYFWAGFDPKGKIKHEAFFFFKHARQALRSRVRGEAERQEQTRGLSLPSKKQKLVQSLGQIRDPTVFHIVPVFLLDISRH